MVMMSRRAHLDAEIRRCKEKLGRLGSAEKSGAFQQTLAKAAQDAATGSDSVLKNLNIGDKIPVVLEIFGKLRETGMSTEGLKDNFHTRKEAYVLALQLRTQMITLCSMIQNTTATWALLVGDDATALNAMKDTPLALGGDTPFGIIAGFIAIAAAPLPAATDTEASRAIRHTLVRQRRMVMRQLVSVVVLALQLADEKGVTLPASA
jgi:hypothetical protein